jgi:hypothetical protein
MKLKIQMKKGSFGIQPARQGSAGGAFDFKLSFRF